MCIWQQYYDQEVLDGGFFSKRASYIYFVVFVALPWYLEISKITCNSVTFLVAMPGVISFNGIRYLHYLLKIFYHIFIIF